MKKDDADHGLAVEQFSDLNKRFYRAEPHAYFTRRFNSMMLYIGRPEDVAALFRNGVKFDKLEFSWGDGDIEDAEELEQYATTEAVVLLHHVAEALIRLFLAHEDGAACPWLELARLRRHDQFWKEVERLPERLELPEHRECVARVFMGAVNAEDLQPLPEPEVWAESLDAICTLLARAADILVSEAALYNSAKHGLAVVAGNNALKLGTDEDIDISVEGPALSILERRTAPQRQPQWCETTVWVPLSATLATTRVMIQQIEALWSVARHRYTDAEKFSMSRLTREVLDVTMRKTNPTSPFQIPSFTVNLAYYEGSSRKSTPSKNRRRK
jgi:hypothetical protein